MDRASAGCGTPGRSWHPPRTQLPGQRGTGSATGPRCGSRLSPSGPHHSTGTPTELPLSLVVPRESPERLCPDRALLRLCCRAERGTASTDTSTSMVTPSLQTDTGLRAGAQRGTAPKGGQPPKGEAARKGSATPPAPSAQPPCPPVRGVLALAQHAPCKCHRAGRLAVPSRPRRPRARAAAAAGEGGGGVWSSLLPCPGVGQHRPQLIHCGERQIAVPKGCPSPQQRGHTRAWQLVALTFGQVVQLHPAQVCGAAAPPAAPAAPAQRQHHGPVHVGEHQGHTDTCRGTRGHCQPQPGCLWAQTSPTGTAPLPSRGSALGTHPR